MNEDRKYKSPSPFEKRAMIGLGVVLLGLAVNLLLGNPLFRLLFSGGVNAGSRPAPSSPSTAAKDVAVKDAAAKPAARTVSKRGAKTPVKDQDEFARYDPSLHLDELEEVLDRPLPQLDRNPFLLEPTPQEIKQKEAEAKPQPPPPPPPPPPIPLKAVGFAEKLGGPQEAYICETSVLPAGAAGVSSADAKCRDDVEVYVVHEGEEFGKHYKAVKLAPTQVDVVDEATGQSAQLLVPQ